MGSRTTRPQKGQADRAYSSGVAIDSITSTSFGEGRDDGIEIPLVNVNKIVLSETQIGECVVLKRFEANTPFGRLGDIPHNYQKLVKERDFKNGVVSNINIPAVYFHG
ncbi:hypothetical protein [Acaryochloris sp. CCMEE 5410]|uniref:hypothetical protein n=1 Tax=Acaryochloris sp. CCMEE 5410 TaxID=310037 RepID=UPI00024846ED|nr:hypothetical protein [Acaryochloris sp. CCMEE 5410]KAI9131104.1 hypothetical protein ON05_025875 [Acaryochloris sp. CCMEE 5410]